MVKAFEEKYGVEVKISTFNDTDEAITKIRTGAVPFDIYFPSYDQIGRLVTADLVRPLNHSYLGNLGNVWEAFADPWYDGEARYSVPYSIYTTGIGWRTDQVTEDIAALAQPVRRALGPGVLRSGGRHRRLAHRDGDGGAARRHHRHQHRQARGPRRSSTTG